MNTTYPPEVIKEMRDWLCECTWADADESDIIEVSDEQVVRAVRKTFDGGIAGFMACYSYES